MKKYNFFNRSMPVVEDLLQEQISKEASIRLRQTDVHTWGILPTNDVTISASTTSLTPPASNIPVSSLNPSPNIPYRNLEFPLSFDTNLGRVDVGKGSGTIGGGSTLIGGVAENLIGERIGILLDANYDGSTSGPYGVKNTGNLAIPLPGIGTYYLWIDYLEVNMSQAEMDKGGNTHYPFIEDGYKISITTTPLAPSGDGLSVFLGKVIWAVVAAGSLPVTRGLAEDLFGNSVTTQAAEIGRVYRLQRANTIEAFPDQANPPAAYGFGVRTTLQDHVSGLGSGTPTTKNVHALTIFDIAGGTLEPKALKNQEESLANGIVDRTISTNADISAVTPLTLSIVPAAITSAAAVDPSLNPYAAYMDSVQASTGFQQFLRVKDFSSIPDPSTGLTLPRGAYVQGQRVVQLYPNMRISDKTGDPSILPSDPNSGDGYVGFLDSDATGIYQILGAPIVIAGTEILYISKKFLASTFSIAVPDAPYGMIALGLVYWNTTSNALFRDYLEASPVPVDTRSAGLVGNSQISTEGKMDANKGILSGTVLENLVANSNFLLSSSGGTFATDFPGWSMDVSTTIPKANVSRFTNGAFASILTGGPGAVSGIKLLPVAAQASAVNIYGVLSYLKPNTFYAVSFWYFAETAWNLRLQADLVDAGTFSSVAMNPQDVLIQNQGSNWYRTSAILKTGASVDPSANGYALQLAITVPSGVSTTGALRLTNISLTEGEFVSGYMRGRYLPAGANVFFDKLSVCPPGFKENEDMRGMIALGWMPSTASPNPGTNGLQTPGTSLNDPIYDGTLKGAGGAGGAVDIGASFTGASGSAKFVEPTNTTPLPFRVGIWCETI